MRQRFSKIWCFEDYVSSVISQDHFAPTACDENKSESKPFTIDNVKKKKKKRSLLQAFRVELHTQIYGSTVGSTTQSREV